MQCAETPQIQFINPLQYCESCIIRILHTMMSLDEYLIRHGLSGPAFAARIGVDAATVYRIRRGQVQPHRRTIRAIIRETSAQVTVNDLIYLGSDELDDGAQPGTGTKKNKRK